VRLQENIDLQSTILSRFDLIFIVKDERIAERDMQVGSGTGGTALHDGCQAVQALCDPGCKESCSPVLRCLWYPTQPEGRSNSFSLLSV
jgi:hypothetical protein